MGDAAYATIDPSGATPLRALGTATGHGYRLLSNVGSTYRDGAEDAVLHIIETATDRSAASDELLGRATGWAQRYHLDPARANVLRAVDLPANARVLEIGAGCGAVTRYLGEQCAVVDALEPVPARAAAAAARTADLPGVRVVVGALDDVPPDAVYDVVVVIGVLEYVGAGAASERPYLDFLTAVRARLAPAGTLVLAIENKLGVKYLAGSPEDHTARVFDGVEGYPRGGRARTFSRRELEALLSRAGFRSETLMAFPDYKMTRAVLGEFPAAARSLLHRIPQFPSPDWQQARPRVADERSLWRELVAAGVERDFGNSFVVLADADHRSALWPDDRAGVFFSTDRRRRLQVRTDIRLAEDSVRFVRGPREGVAHDAVDGVRIAPSDTSYRPGTDLSQLIAQHGVDAFGRYAARWLALLDEALRTDAGAVADLVPHNLVVGEDDELHPIDIEFVGFPMTRERVLRRGVLRLAITCAPLAPPERWAPARTIGELAAALGASVGLAVDGSWLETAVHEEVDFLSRVRPEPPAGQTQAQWDAKLEARTRSWIATPLSAGPLGPRSWEQAATLRAQLKEAKDDRTRLARDVSELTARLTAAERARRRLARSPELRVGRRLRRGVDVLLPPGSSARSRVRRWLG